MPSVDWQKFWSTYRKKEVRAEDDLFFEVGKTVNQRPISEAAFQLSIDLVRRGLELSPSDKLLELCCGNGLMTRRLAPLVSEIRAVDFAEHLVANARRFAPAENVTYVCADAIAYLNDVALTKDYIPSKILLGDALCYFEPDELAVMLGATRQLTSDNFTFMATGIPCHELKWNFYNTPERVQRYEENQTLPDNTNDGIGRWWRKEELKDVARQLNLRCVVINQPPELSAFRIDAVLETRS
jgi:SAM-dependent methyltransferase